MEPTSFSIELLPKGVFIITLENGQKTKGRFSMYALNRFCVSKNITLMEAIGKIALQMTIEEYAELVVFALQDYYREDVAQCPWTATRVMDEIFECMGLGGEQALNFFKHAIGRITTIAEDQASDEEAKGLSEEEKKSETKS